MSLGDLMISMPTPVLLATLDTRPSCITFSFVLFEKWVPTGKGLWKGWRRIYPPIKTGTEVTVETIMVVVAEPSVPTSKVSCVPSGMPDNSL